jgi:hypothetical protein
MRKLRNAQAHQNGRASSRYLSARRITRRFERAVNARSYAATEFAKEGKTGAGMLVSVQIIEFGRSTPADTGPLLMAIA